MHPKNQHEPFLGTPVVAAAIHDGHSLRPDVARFMKLGDSERLREEDPFTARWTNITPWQVVGRRSRFEVDLNRPRNKAVYQRPEDCWNLDVWTEPLPAEVVEDSLAIHDRFYADVHSLLSGLIERYGQVLVYDLHTYNHRRNGPDRPPEPAAENPEVNVGTGSMPAHWRPVAETFVQELSRADFQGRRLDVRVNVKFQGGYFSQWVHEQFPDSACCLAIEFKKFFMNEWTGEPDEGQLQEIEHVLARTLPSVVQAMSRLTASRS